MYDTVLVGTDGSASANRAVTHALDEAEQHDAALHAIFVVDTGRYAEPALSSSELVTDEIEDWGKTNSKRSPSVPATSASRSRRGAVTARPTRKSSATPTPSTPTPSSWDIRVTRTVRPTTSVA